MRNKKLFKLYLNSTFIIFKINQTKPSSKFKKEKKNYIDLTTDLLKKKKKQLV